MEVIETNLEGLLLIKPKIFGDARGYFLESYQEKRYKENGISCSFIQDNLSRSQKGILRGLHFQTKQAQDKLVTVIRGAVFDVTVDIRKNSPTFGKSFSVILNEENHYQLFIPKGFAHGFYVLSDIADFFYKCSDYYAPQFESGIIWNDPDLEIDWPFKKDHIPTLSSKDQMYQPLKDIDKNILPKI